MTLEERVERIERALGEVYWSGAHLRKCALACRDAKTPEERQRAREDYRRAWDSNTARETDVLAEFAEFARG